mmetsp:Transcript_134644/g.259072  ORF Transcript_134644/g.259072 Transcript_134644/m.259072 type:complete len:254 (-) Transcript_134644:83-844(-)
MKDAIIGDLVTDVALCIERQSKGNDTSIEVDVFVMDEWDDIVQRQITILLESPMCKLVDGWCEAPYTGDGIKGKAGRIQARDADRAAWKGAAGINSLHSLVEAGQRASPDLHPAMIRWVDDDGFISFHHVISEQGKTVLVCFRTHRRHSRTKVCQRYVKLYYQSSTVRDSISHSVSELLKRGPDLREVLHLHPERQALTGIGYGGHPHCRIVRLPQREALVGHVCHIRLRGVEGAVRVVREAEGCERIRDGSD